MPKPDEKIIQESDSLYLIKPKKKKKKKKKGKEASPYY